MGWFGWSFITMLVVTIIGSTLFFFNVFQLDLGSIFNRGETAGGTEQAELTEEDNKEIERVRADVGKEHTELGQYVSDMHKYYNKTTGYGSIGRLDWDDQREKADELIEKMEGYITEVENPALSADIERIQELANAVLDEKESDHVRQLHRYFHDLDIALNEYKEFDRIWNVTETLKGLSE